MLLLLTTIAGISYCWCNVRKSVKEKRRDPFILIVDINFDDEPGFTPLITLIKRKPGDQRRKSAADTLIIFPSKLNSTIE